MSAAQRFVGGDHQHADQRADPDQAPVDVVLDHALRQRRDQAGLRRRQRVLVVRPGRAGETVGMVEQIEDRRNDRGAGDDADDQRHLLLPRRGIDELAGLQILQVVVGDGGRGEHHRGDEQRVGHQRRPPPAGRPERMPGTRSSAAPITTRMPMPDSGLLEEPMRPAM